jgi:type IV secretory pathway ATPase VirB11/archaellum biosynthesis ATPase
MRNWTGLETIQIEGSDVTIAYRNVKDYDGRYNMEYMIVGTINNEQVEEYFDAGDSGNKKYAYERWYEIEELLNV